MRYKIITSLVSMLISIHMPNVKQEQNIYNKHSYWNFSVCNLISKMVYDRSSFTLQNKKKKKMLNKQITLPHNLLFIC